ncbi:MAG: histidinol-phosphate transaminase [Flavobacteriales bacterium]|nr:histidinol-phosphate transaminase [Flavobacteriales bacterium]
MVRIPSNIQDLVSYKPGKPVAQIVQELGLKEWAVLWNNENNLGPSPKALSEIQSALALSHLYPDPSAEKLCSLIAQENDCTSANVTVDNGSESVFDCMLRAFFEPGDELLTCEGTFVAVYIWAKANNVHCEKIPLAAGYQFDIDQLIASVGPKTKAIYVANPNNPTGAMISRVELERLVHSVSKEVLVIVDEAYFEYAKALSEEYPDSFQMRRPNVITLRTFSKAHGIAGIRVGYALGPQPLIESIRKVRMTFAPSHLSQAAAVGAIQDVEHVQKTVEVNRKALSQYYGALENAGLSYTASFGNFVMVDLGSEEDAKQFVNAMLHKGVFIRHLRAFGLAHCVRISTGTVQENDLLARSLASL